MLYYKSEPDAEERRWLFVCVDDTDGKTAETGLTFSGGELQISKAGGAWANFAGSVTELSDGTYVYEATTTELNTNGVLGFKVEKSGVRTTIMSPGMVVSFDPHAGNNLGLLALPNVAVGNSGGLIVSGTGAHQLSVSSGRANADVLYWNAAAVATPTVAGVPEVDVTHWLGSAAAAYATAANQTTIINYVDTLETSMTTVNSKLDAIDDYVDTVEATLSTVDTKLDAIDDYIDTEVAAIKAKTDLIPADPATETNVDAAETAILAAIAALVIPTVSAIADAVWDEVMENGKTARQWMRGFKAALWGRLNRTTSTREFRDDADTKARIIATVGAGGRTSVTEDLD